ncbi:DUF563 domain-containing protein [Rhodoblastus sp.]|uniref:glycosyltransferase family 61 protein n=1 Tax=Rhodoblastus sp. TaxID=1962975 RepID=UPI0035B43188
MELTDERVIFGRVSDLDQVEAPSPLGSIILEEEQRFFQYHPVIVSNDVDANYEMPAIWDHVRYRHSTVIRHIRDCLVFGSNFVVDSEQNTFCDELSFRRGAFEFYNVFIRGLAPGNLPECIFSDGGLSLRWSSDPMQKAICIDEPVYLLTPIEHDNWGRWICQVLPRLEYVKRLDPDYKILIRCSASWQRQFLQFCEIDLSRVIEQDPTKIYKIKTLKSFQHNAVDFTVSLKEMDLYKKISSRFRKKDGSYENIFLSRRHIALRNGQYRVLENEDKLIERLEKLNFRCFEPELHSFEEQISCLSSARNIVGLGGSAIFNAVFCPDDARYITVESQPTFIATHTGFLASLSLWHGVIFGRPIDLAQCGVNAHANWTVDIERALQAISQAMRG